MELNNKFYSGNHQEHSQCFPYAGRLVEYAISNFYWHVSYYILLFAQYKCHFWFSQPCWEKAQNYIYPQHCYGSGIAFPLTISSSFIKLKVYHFIILFARFPISNSKSTILRMISNQLRNCESLVHPHMVDICVQRMDKNNIISKDIFMKVVGFFGSQNLIPTTASFLKVATKAFIHVIHCL